MKIVFDLDGVLRELSQYLVEKYKVPYPKVWDWKYKGKNFWDYAQEDDNMFLFAPITEYLEIVKKYITEPEIWTCQRDEYREHTTKWISENISKQCNIFYASTIEKRKMLDRRTDTILVEDNPNFTHYDRIVLIDRPYNQEIKSFLRIKNPKELENLILWA